MSSTRRIYVKTTSIPPNCVLVGGMLLIASAVVITNSATAAGAQQRPIEDFLVAQGTFCVAFDAMGPVCDAPPPDCILFVPPVANFVGLNDPVSLLAASVDYAGLADAWISAQDGGVSFGTQFCGSITERSLNDGTGRVEVHVRLHTTNALAWAFECEPGPACDFGGATTVFGNRAPAVLAGAAMALGDSYLRLKFISSGFDAPMPDLLQLLVGCGGADYEFPSVLQFVATAQGTRADGTPATLKVTQVGMFANPGQGAVADGFPVENVVIVP